MTKPSGGKRAEEIAESLFDEIVHLDDDSEGNVHDFVDAKEFTEEIAKALEEYKREAIVEMFEGEDSVVAEIEWKAFEEGFKQGAVQMKIRCKKLADAICPDENYGDRCHESIAERIGALELFGKII